MQARSHESLLAEARKITAEPDFKGYINDVGGPTANFRQPACKNQLKHGACLRKRCLWPHVCRSMDVDHTDYVALLRKLRALPGVKKVFVRSGIRFDYALADADDTFIRELCAHHVSGQLKVAPEHVSDAVLSVMGKPSRAVYDRFVEKYRAVNRELGKDQYLVPYLMSSHPGSTLKEAVELAEYVRDMGYMPEQVQDFYPTPSTMSTAMYYTGVDPRTMKPVYVPRSAHEKALQRALIPVPQARELRPGARGARARGTPRPDWLRTQSASFGPCGRHGQKTGKHAGSKHPAAGSGRRAAGGASRTARAAPVRRGPAGTACGQARTGRQATEQQARGQHRRPQPRGQGREANRGGHRG